MKGSVPTSLEKLQALVVWGIRHEVDSGVTSIIVSNAQIARTPQHAQVDLPREERRSVSEPRGGQASRPPSPPLRHLGRLLVLLLFLETSRPRHWGLRAGEAGRGHPGCGARRRPARGGSESHGLGDAEDLG